MINNLNIGYNDSKRHLSSYNYGDIFYMQLYISTENVRIRFKNVNQYYKIPY